MLSLTRAKLFKYDRYDSLIILWFKRNIINIPYLLTLTVAADELKQSEDNFFLLILALSGVMSGRFQWFSSDVGYIPNTTSVCTMSQIVTITALGLIPFVTDILIILIVNLLFQSMRM